MPREFIDGQLQPWINFSLGAAFCGAAVCRIRRRP
jgi:hypothetical protein